MEITVTDSDDVIVFHGTDREFKEFTIPKTGWYNVVAKPLSVGGGGCTKPWPEEYMDTEMTVYVRDSTDDRCVYSGQHTPREDTVIIPVPKEGFYHVTLTNEICMVSTAMKTDNGFVVKFKMSNLNF